MEKIEMNRKRKVHLLARQPLWHGAKLWGRVLLLRHDHIQVSSIVLLFCKTKRKVASQNCRKPEVHSFIHQNDCQHTQEVQIKDLNNFLNI